MEDWGSWVQRCLGQLRGTRAVNDVIGQRAIVEVATAATPRNQGEDQPEG